jgi:hypothetical protein
MKSSRSFRTAVVAAAAFIGLVLPATAQAAKNWAVVESNGTLVRGNNIATTTRLNSGTYAITFDHNISRCGYVANPGDTAAGAVTDSAVASVARRAGNPRTVYLQTYNETTHALADEPFHLVAYCGVTSKFAVVGKGGALSRGSHALSAHRIVRGEYSVHFDRDVSNCVFTATIGATGITPVTAPGDISVSPGNKPHNVFVATIGANGSLKNFPFHLAAACGTVPLRAVVKKDGTFVRGRNVTSTRQINPGRYEVIFTQNVSTCAFTATVGSPGVGISTLPLTITTATRAGNPNGVFLFIHDAAANQVFHAFHLVVRC